MWAFERPSMGHKSLRAAKYTWLIDSLYPSILLFAYCCTKILRRLSDHSPKRLTTRPCPRDAAIPNRRFTGLVQIKFRIPQIFVASLTKTLGSLGSSYRLDK